MAYIFEFYLLLLILFKLNVSAIANYTISKVLSNNDNKTNRSKIQQNLTNVSVYNLSTLPGNSTLSSIYTDTSGSHLNRVTIFPDSCNCSVNLSHISDVLPSSGLDEVEKISSLAIFLVFTILALGILLIHSMITLQCTFLPDSVAMIFLGAIVGCILYTLSTYGFYSWKKEEAFSPTVFFLVILPPIMFESGYNLHKGDFFQNIGSILLFAVVGTCISAFVVSAGIYSLGYIGLSYNLQFSESFAFGSLISAVDPIATLAIFKVLKVDPVLNMLVFGESILNDAVSIVLTATAIETYRHKSEVLLFSHFLRFLEMFIFSASIGTITALLAALLFKHVRLSRHPSLELSMLLIFIYAPYGLAEGLRLSGIMSILFCGIVMSHYTQLNLSSVTRITMQNTVRSVAFVAETCAFAYIGLAIFSFNHNFQFGLIFWSFILILLGRALNIFPLSSLANRFRDHKITFKMQFIMWASGLRGAIAYALCLCLDFPDDTRHALVTTTVSLVITSILLFGFLTKPLLRYLNVYDLAAINSRETLISCNDNILENKNHENCPRFNFSKTSELNHISSLLSTSTRINGNSKEHNDEYKVTRPSFGNECKKLKGFAYFDAVYLMPFFTIRTNNMDTSTTRVPDNYVSDKISNDESDIESFGRQHDMM